MAKVYKRYLIKRMLTRALCTVWLIGIFINGIVYAALQEPKPVKPQCLNQAAFTVLASALKPAKGK